MVNYECRPRSSAEIQTPNTLEPVPPASYIKKYLLNDRQEKILDASMLLVPLL
jgi:hypothetical protein